VKSETSAKKIWDAIVIGGGPAGMMAAGRAAERGKTVLLLEKNRGLGKKLLITGGGRCNLTNYKPEMNTLVASYKGKPKALYSVFSQFGVEDTLNFFHSHGLGTKLEAEGRMFPITDKAESVWEVLVDYIQTRKVGIQTGAAVTGIAHDAATELFTIKLKDDSLLAKSCIVATGGTSHPETGSTGDGFKWLRTLGHTIIDNNFALVPVALKDNWVKNLSGVTLQDIKLNVVQDGKRHDSRSGRLLFTHFGISGPTVLNLSSKIGDLLQYGEVIVELDLLPDLDHTALKAELYELLATDNNKKIKNSLGKLIASSLVDPVLIEADVDGEKANNSITREERVRLIQLMKAMPMHVQKLLGADKAIVSSGGVKIEEVNFQTMESRLIPGLYVVGDVLNIDRPSGGYSLQLCWATGFVAGNNC
jgi:predicted Rossmann fold flavoprotein